MPCSDHGPPAHLRKTAQVYSTIYKHIPPLLLPPLNLAIIKDADDIWCQTDHAEAVCSILKELSLDGWNSLKYHLPSSREVRELYNWWEDHQKMDESRK